MPDLLPCPNPECRSKETTTKELVPELFSAKCRNCQLFGPDAPTSEEAARLWNLLPRHEPSTRDPSIQELKDSLAASRAAVLLTTQRLLEQASSFSLVTPEPRVPPPLEVEQLAFQHLRLVASANWRASTMLEIVGYQEFAQAVIEASKRLP